MPIAIVHVHNGPLPGPWDGQNWDAQTARASNNFLGGGPTPPVAPAIASGGLIWRVVGLSDPGAVTFNVSVDLPGDDENAPMSNSVGLRDGILTSYLQPPSITSLVGQSLVPFHNSVPYAKFYERGLYIAQVNGADRPFFIHVLGAAEVMTTLHHPPVLMGPFANQQADVAMTVHFPEPSQPPHLDEPP